MDFNEYQKLARRTAVYPNIDTNLVYPVLGLCGESGELAEKVKKMMRDDNGQLTDERREAMIKEAGDVLWYLSQLSAVLGVPFEEVARRNIEKLAARYAVGTIHGSGDNR